MKLIYAKGACSLSVHILLEEIGDRYETLQVSLKDKRVLETFNVKSYVPTLVLNNGEILTEATTILQYLAENYEREDLLPPAGTIERARCLEWLTYISTELHKGMGPLFHRDQLSEDFRQETTKKIEKRLSFMDQHLAKKKYLVGETFTIADMYAIAILRIAEHIKINLTQFPNVMTYKQMLEEMPVVQKVVSLENKEEVAERAA
jgi:glutathione S-transferase